MISIFALILRYKIPLVNLPVHRGIAGGYGGSEGDTEFKRVRVVGVGTLCFVIRYATESHMEDVCPLGMLIRSCTVFPWPARLTSSGILVALKRYHSA